MARTPAALHGLARQIATLEAFHGPPPKPPATVFEAVLWENCAYLVDDARRAATFRALAREVGLSPRAILQTPPGRLAEVIAEGGMLAPHRAAKLLEAAAVAVEVGLKDLDRMIRESPLKSRKVLKRFPGIGDPGADYLLLLAHAEPSLGPESNGLRVLQRLGYGSDKGSYSQQYKSVAKDVRAELREEYAWLLKARALLRRHGQEVCRRAAPLCDACPLSASCRWFRSRRRPD